MVLFLATKDYLPRLNLKLSLFINKGLGSLAKNKNKLINVITEKIEVLKTYLRDELV